MIDNDIDTNNRENISRCEIRFCDVQAGGTYDYPGNMRSPPLRKSQDFQEGVSAPKPRSILRTSQSQGQIQGHSGLTSAPGEGIVNPGGMKKTVSDLRQWQQQHQEELLHQHIETQVWGIRSIVKIAIF
jgi:hypothetical protein